MNATFSEEESNPSGAVVLPERRTPIRRVGGGIQASQVWKPAIQQTWKSALQDSRCTHPGASKVRDLVRVIARGLWLLAEIVRAALNYIGGVLLQSRAPDHLARARWLQQACRRALRLFNVELRAIGPVPDRGLLVSNHLSYLDILVLGALAPASFVSKSEVRGWPVFGWFAARAGTIFVRRARRSEVGRSTAAIETALDRGGLLVLFPEGTSSDGATVLPFKSALLEPATSSRWPVSACGLAYALADGDAAEEACYWRDMTLVPHLLNLLRKEGVSATVHFTVIATISPNRKNLAQQLHAEVSRLAVSANLQSV